jgi:putative glutamine amidotransferase
VLPSSRTARDSAVGAARPVIGLTCYVEDVDRSPWVGQRSAVLPYPYVEKVQRAGGLAVVLPPREDVDEVMAERVLERLDGLVVGGGADVHATRYDAEAHPSAQDPRHDRDEWEIALVRAARVLDLPVLGICRGMQVLAVAAGAGLDQHLPDLVGHEAHCPRPGVYASHHVVPVPGTRLADLLGTGPLDVPTYHHQAVRAPTLAGSGWVPSAWHEDGTLEAMEDPSGRYRVAVQWHAEEEPGAALFEGLVTAARRDGVAGR